MTQEKESTWITGTVRRGDGRGRDLGFPTANIVLDNPELRPLNGVYACWVKLDNDSHKHKGALHVGPVPTFNKEAVTVEIHLLDFPNEDLYDKKVSFSCVKHLRSVVKFDTVEALKEALKKDCIETEKVLNNYSK